ncbi:MAG: heavy metal-binding domain-containing protein [Verrucomicrobiota bacterium]
MKNKLILPMLIAALALTAGGFGITGCKKSESETHSNQAHKYTCTMHPEVVQDAPGKCPKCDMALVQKHDH